MTIGRLEFLIPALLGALVWAASAPAATLAVAPGGLGAALAAAAPGDELVLQPGIHPGPVTVSKPVTLRGEAGAVIDGNGQANSLTITVPDVAVRGLTIRNSGLSLSEQNSGIFISKEAARVTIEDNTLVDNLIGIYVWGAADSLVRHNHVTGRTDLRVSERGNGIQLWNAPGTKIVDNIVEHGRDGIFVTTSRNNLFQGNRFEHVRFAVHYMYTNRSEVSDNVSIGNDVGLAIMQSDQLVIRNNLSDGDREHGLLFNYANSSRIEGNTVRNGGEKCLFIYNANKNSFRDNRFEGCRIGIHFTAGSERNTLSGNAFINNRTQVLYVGTRSLDWSDKGRGNYWSDNPAFDLNGDGIADEAYRPNDVVDRVMWTYPAAKLLLNSPGIQVIRWAQAQFPALHPGGVIDSAPLMKPPALTTAAGEDLP
jgi:nitrous oxidase accessory protein